MLEQDKLGGIKIFVVYHISSTQNNEFNVENL